MNTDNLQNQNRVNKIKTGLIKSKGGVRGERSSPALKEGSEGNVVPLP